MVNGNKYLKVPVEDIQNDEHLEEEPSDVDAEIEKKDTIFIEKNSKVLRILKKKSFFFFVVFFVTIVVLSIKGNVKKLSQIQNHPDSKKNLSSIFFPKALLGTVYNESIDFENKYGNVPAYWQELNTALNHCSDNKCNISNDSWGPCYPPDRKNIKSIETEFAKIITKNETKLEYPESWIIRKKKHTKGLDNLCRPGFLIIGAGKCGTSSLYHYLTGHPRVLPASEKQIHYFKYYPDRDLACSGALMTGEAAPGYIPYPSVANLVKTRMPGPKIITIAREPLDRAWSSYNYNYVRDALNSIRRGSKYSRYPKNKTDEFYKEHYIFPFEDFIRTELQLLKKCLEPGGLAETMSKKKYGKIFNYEMERRETEKLPPMVDIIGICYPQPQNRRNPREQWKEMIANNPDRYIHTPNLHLLEALIGRGMYSVQVEWWYAAHPTRDNYLVCSEHLKTKPAETMLNVSQFLGLPDFNFADVVGEGMFNVAGHKGYDHSISWEVAQKEEETRSENKAKLSDPLKKELMEFLEEHNERLFALTGKRCPW